MTSFKTVFKTEIFIDSLRMLCQVFKNISSCVLIMFKLKIVSVCMFFLYT